MPAGCAVGPDYRRPTVSTPDKFKEMAGWKQAQPSDAVASSAWWEALQDSVLDKLEEQVATSNQTLLQDAANYEQARQLARADRATFWPTLSAEGSAIRANEPAGRGGAASAASSAGGVTVLTPATGGPSNSFAASLDASWSPDFWGRIRRLTEADVAAAQISAADLAAARLSSQASLAQDYIGVRVQDDKIRLLENAVKGYLRTLTITKNKYGVGVAAEKRRGFGPGPGRSRPGPGNRRRRAAGPIRTRHRHTYRQVARPAGHCPAPACRTVDPAGSSRTALRTPGTASRRGGGGTGRGLRQCPGRSADGGLFSDHRPVRQRRLRGSTLASLFSAPNRFWTLGGNVGETLLDFGQRRAQVFEARAAYDASAANYRQTVLGAFQQVEDDLASLRILGEEAKVEDIAVSDAATATRITVNEYDAGTVDYTTVVTAEVNELNDREAALTILQTRLDSAVALIQALGGGWTQGDLPSRSQVMARASQAPSAVAAPR